MGVLGRVFLPGGERTRIFQLAAVGLLVFLAIRDLPEDEGERQGAIIFTAFIAVWLLFLAGWAGRAVLAVYDGRHGLTYATDGRLARDLWQEFRADE